MDIVDSIKTEFLTDIETHLHSIVTTYAVNNRNAREPKHAHAEALYVLYKDQLNEDAYILKHAEEYIQKKRKEGGHVNFFGSMIYNTVMKYAVYWNDKNVHLTKLSEHIQKSDMSALDAVSRLYVYTVLATLYMLSTDPDYNYNYKTLNNKYDLSNKLKTSVLNSFLEKNKDPVQYDFSKGIHTKLARYNKSIELLESEIKVQKSRYYTIYNNLSYTLESIDKINNKTLDIISSEIQVGMDAIFNLYKHDISKLYYCSSNASYGYVGYYMGPKYKFGVKYDYSHKKYGLGGVTTLETMYILKLDEAIDKLNKEFVNSIHSTIYSIRLNLLNSFKKIVDDVSDVDIKQLHKELNKLYLDRDNYVGTHFISELYGSVL